MALADTVTGTGQLVDSSGIVTEYGWEAYDSTVDPPVLQGTWKVVETRLVVKHAWYALTETAASTWIGTPATPIAGSNISRSISQTNNVINAWSAEETVETVTTVRTYTPEE